jgi:hypothetical protein
MTLRVLIGTPSLEFGVVRRYCFGTKTFPGCLSITPLASSLATSFLIDQLPRCVVVGFNADEARIGQQIGKRRGVTVGAWSNLQTLVITEHYLSRRISDLPGVVEAGNHRSATTTGPRQTLSCGAHIICDSRGSDRQALVTCRPRFAL